MVRCRNLELLHFVQRAANSDRLLVLGTCRDGKTDNQRALGALVDGLAARGSLTEIVLSNLEADDATRLAMAMTDLSADDAAMQRVVQTASGNPFFLVELARQVTLAHNARGGSRPTPPPRIKTAVARGSADSRRPPYS